MHAYLYLTERKIADLSLSSLSLCLREEKTRVSLVGLFGDFVE